VRTRVRFLVLAAAVAGASVLTACSSGAGTGSTSPAAASSSRAPSSPAATVAASTAAPAGYHRIGGATQGVSVEVPAYYTTVSANTVKSAEGKVKKLGLNPKATAA